MDKAKIIGQWFWLNGAVSGFDMLPMVRIEEVNYSIPATFGPRGIYFFLHVVWCRRVLFCFYGDSYRN